MNQKPTKVAARLTMSLEQAIPVIIHRRVDPNDPLEALVLEISDDWVLLASLRDGGFSMAIRSSGPETSPG